MIMSKFYGEKSLSQSRETWLISENAVDRSNLPQLTLPAFISFGLLNDPKQIGFRIARHKFVMKMLTGFESVLEVGCQEGFTSLFVAQEVGQLVAIDFYKPHIEDAEQFLKPHLPNVEFRGHDIIDGPIVDREFDGAFSLDVLEHIDQSQEHLFMANIAASLKQDGVFIVGMPSLESQQYASEAAKAGHINCKTGQNLQTLCKLHFNNVFMFGMNDEVLHTGFFPMCQYLFPMCIGKKMD